MEKCIDLKKTYEIVETQEKLLQFDSFTNANARELGCLEKYLGIEVPHLTEEIPLL